MSAGEWTALTGLPYENITMMDRGAPVAPVPGVRQHTDPKLQALDDALNKQNALDNMLTEEADAKSDAKVIDAMTFDESLVESVMKQHLGPEITEGAVNAVVESGEFDMEALAKLGVDDCKFACNSDPLRGGFRAQFRPPH